MGTEKNFHGKWFLGGCANRMQCDGRNSVYDHYCFAIWAASVRKKNIRPHHKHTYKSYKMKEVKPASAFSFSETLQTVPQTIYLLRCCLLPAGFIYIPAVGFGLREIAAIK